LNFALLSVLICAGELYICLYSAGLQFRHWALLRFPGSLYLLFIMAQKGMTKSYFLIMCIYPFLNSQQCCGVSALVAKVVVAVVVTAAVVVTGLVMAVAIGKG
jgi:hypothetical protein